MTPSNAAVFGALGAPLELLTEGDAEQWVPLEIAALKGARA
jgi:hypothetical protein